MTEPSPDRLPPEALARYAQLSDRLTATRSKLEKRALLAGYLQSLSLADAGRAALYLAGVPFAETDPRQLQVGGSALSKAVAQLAGASQQALGQAYRRHGDLGDAAFDLLAHHTPVSPPLALGDLEEALAGLPGARGPAAKLLLLLELLARATAAEARYIIKLAAGDMRTGVKQSLVEEAIAQAYGAEPAEVRRAVMLNGSLPEVVLLAGSGRLAEARMRLFHPLGFMLASPVETVEDALARFAEEVTLEAAGQGAAASPVAPVDSDGSERLAPGAEIHAGEVGDDRGASSRAQVEDKYDGVRAQLHCGDPTQPGRVGLFSRNREEIAGSFPELTEAFSSFPEPVILDGEILAWQPGARGATLPGGPDPDRAAAPFGDPASGLATGAALGRALPFSSLQQRLGRKRVTAELREAIPVVFMAFDILYAGGTLLLEEPLARRRALLENLVERHAPATAIASGAHHPAHDSAQRSLFASSGGGAEEAFARLRLAPAVGLTGAAQLDRAYEQARERGNEGVMLKALGSLYQPGRRGLAWLKLKRQLATLDVVITGAEFGNGRRAQVLSDYTFAVRGADGTLQNVGKTYSGLTDAEIEELSRALMEQTLEDRGHFRTVEPSVILEVAFNNITRSTRHGSGFALRFPRILRIRQDKPLEEIDTVARVEEIYDSQPDRPVEAAEAEPA